MALPLPLIKLSASLEVPEPEYGRDTGAGIRVRNSGSVVYINRFFSASLPEGLLLTKPGHGTMTYMAVPDRLDLCIGCRGPFLPN